MDMRTRGAVPLKPSSALDPTIGIADSPTRNYTVKFGTVVAVRRK
jgi:hypothetical protein